MYCNEQFFFFIYNSYQYNWITAAAPLGSHQGRTEGNDPPLWPAGRASFDVAQDTFGFLCCRCTLLDHVQLFIHQHPEVFLLRAAHHSTHHAVCVWDCPDSCAGPCTWPCWTAWCSYRWLSQASGWHPFTAACQRHYTAQCHQCWGCTRYHCPCHQQKVLKCASPNASPGAMALVTTLHLDIKTLIATLTTTIQPVSYPLCSLPVKSTPTSILERRMLCSTMSNVLHKSR